jgi:peroxiredoxin Q/BCP
MSSTIKVGDRAPDFELTAVVGEDGPGVGNEAPVKTRKIRLSDYVGKKNVVLFFYPKDETAGCTVEACSFRDSHQDFVDAGAEVIGISSDSVDSHARFAARHHLPMLLLSDPSGAIAARYGIRKALGFIPGRVTFLVDRSGIVRHVTDGRLRLRGHASEALATLKQLTA